MGAVIGDGGDVGDGVVFVEVWVGFDGDGDGCLVVAGGVVVVGWVEGVCVVGDGVCLWVVGGGVGCC